MTGFNSNIGLGGKHADSFWNNEMGAFGNRIKEKDLSSDFKNLAQQYPGGLGSIQKMIANSNYSPDAYKEVNRINGIMRSLDPVMTTEYKKAPLNQLYSVTYGNSFEVFKKHKLGPIMGGNYYRRYTDISGGDLTQYSIYQGVVTGAILMCTARGTFPTILPLTACSAVNTRPIKRIPVSKP